MGYLDNYTQVRNRYRKFLSGKQSRKLLDLSKSFSRRNAFNRVAAASALRTGFRQGFNGLRNTGMENSGEVERLRRRLGADFTYQNQQLNKNELGVLNEYGNAFKHQTIARRNAWARQLAAQKKAEAQVQAAKTMITKSGTRGISGGGSKMLKTVR